MLKKAIEKLAKQKNHKFKNFDKTFNEKLQKTKNLKFENNNVVY